MVAVAKMIRRKTLVIHVIVKIRRGDDDSRGSRIGKNNRLKSGKAVFIQMFNHFHNHGGIVVFKPFIPVTERALK